jgi:hypothetical protein
MQSAQTATLVARMPIVLFFMAYSPVQVLNAQACNAREPTYLFLTVVSATSF